MPVGAALAMGWPSATTSFNARLSVSACWGRNGKIVTAISLSFNARLEGWTRHFTCPVFWDIRPIFQDASLKKRDGTKTYVPFFGSHVSFFRTQVPKNETSKGTRLVSKWQLYLDYKVPNASTFA